MIAGRFQGKTGIVLGLCLMLGTDLIYARAAETLAPAPVAMRQVEIPTAVPEPGKSEPPGTRISGSRAVSRLPVVITPGKIEKKPHRIYAATAVEIG